MKRFSMTLLPIIILVFCTACSRQGNNSAGSSGPFSGDTPNISTGEMSNAAIDNETIVKHDNPRVDYTKEEVAEIIGEHSNFNVSEDIIADIPKSIDHVSKFFCGTTPPLSGKEAISDFLAAFDFIYPEHEFDESCFMFVGPDTAGPGEPVSKYYDEIINDEKKVSLFFYLEDETDKEERVALVCQSPFGNTITTINKNVTSKLAYEMGLRSNYGADVYFPSSDFPCVGRFDSTDDEGFPMMDKEISIKDAAEFYKKYISELPCPIESDYSINVNDVYVYKIRDDLYYFLFTASKLYDGIPFDYAVNGTHGGRDNRDLGMGGMIKSDDVDFVYGTFRLETVTEEEQFTDYLPFEKAMKTVSEKMTSYVDFEVSAVQLVYCVDNDLGTGKLGETKKPVFPAWKITLYNPNDDYSYCCYLNALNGEFESFKES